MLDASSAAINLFHLISILVLLVEFYQRSVRIDCWLLNSSSCSGTPCCQLSRLFQVHLRLYCLTIGPWWLATQELSTYNLYWEFWDPYSVSSGFNSAFFNYSDSMLVQVCCTYHALYVSTTWNRFFLNPLCTTGSLERLCKLKVSSRRTQPPMLKDQILRHTEPLMRRETACCNGQGKSVYPISSSRCSCPVEFL
jgi:hypothetical protein